MTRGGRSSKKWSIAIAGLCAAATAAGRVQTIDPPPEPSARSVVLGRRDIVVGGQSRCAMIVRYRGKVDQPITFIGARCAAVRVAWVTPATLGRRRLDMLSAEEREDMSRAPGERTLLLSATSRGTTVARLFPLNVADRIYGVTLP